jgi:hypothetical protein
VRRAGAVACNGCVCAEGHGPHKITAAVREFDAKQVHASLQCTVEPIKAALNFVFRFPTGYVLRAPLNPDHGGARRWYLVFRVTPEGSRRQPVYFLDTIVLPN